MRDYKPVSMYKMIWNISWFNITCGTGKDSFTRHKSIYCTVDLLLQLSILKNAFLEFIEKNNWSSSFCPLRANVYIT
jgi:hypothetical protein